MDLRQLIVKIVLDGLVLGILGAVALVLQRLEPYKRGYFAEDTTIRLPFKSSTIPYFAVLVVQYGILVITVIIAEVIHEKRGEGSRKSISNFVIPSWIWQSYSVVGVFSFGVLCQQITVDIAKIAIGRLRPNFHDVCKPVVQGTPAPYQYITNFYCQQNDTQHLRAIRMSFPSGHSCLAMYSAVFIILYIQARVTWRGSKLLRHGFQFAVLVFGWWVGLSRVTDHKHHWEDVTVGFLIGIIYAYVAFFYVLGMQKEVLLRPIKRPLLNNISAESHQLSSSPLTPR